MTRKTAIVLALINLTLTALVWVKWGGVSNDMGTLVLLMWLALSNTIIADNTKKVKSKRKIKV